MSTFISAFAIQHSAWPLEIVADPDAELHLAEPGTAGVWTDHAVDRRRVGEQHVLVILVEQRAPRPIEVNRESEGERFEPDAVRGAAVDEPEARDGPRRAIHRHELARRRRIE